MAGTFELKGYEVYKSYSAEQCLKKINDLGSKVDILFVDGKMATDRATMLIKVKGLIRISGLQFLLTTKLIKPEYWAMVPTSSQQN